MTITRRSKSYFIRGLAVLLPTILTLWILAWCYDKIQENIGTHINKGLVEALVWAQKDGLNANDVEALRKDLNRRFVEGWAGSIVGLLIAGVAVEYPRKGIWSLGFVTGEGLRSIADRIECEVLTVMAPTSPTPVTGWVITVPKADTIALDMSVEETLRFIVSAGVVAPTASAPPSRREP
jgi:uncharacterized membrane protein